MLNKDEILAYLRELKPKLEKDGITNLGLFGSFAKNSADLSSDIDITLETTPKFVEKFIGFKAVIYLEDLRENISNYFHRNVDFCDIAGFKNNKEKKDYILDRVIYA